MSHFIVEPPERALIGQVEVPGDKSIGHRALIFSALAEGESQITGLSAGADNLSTMCAMRALGARVRQGERAYLYKSKLEKEPVYYVAGCGLHALSAPSQAIDCGNAGTGMRLLAGVLTGQKFDSVLVGDSSLSGRPMKRIVKPLEAMGGKIKGREHSDNIYPPLHISGGQSLHGITYESPVASAQVKSAILLAGLYADSATTVIEPGPSRDHTERMLAHLGVPVQRARANTIVLDPSRWNRQLAGTHFVVPGDPSSAAFVIAAALICEVDKVAIRGVCTNPTRTGFLEVLAAMGARVEREMSEEDAGGESIATLTVTRGARERLAAARVGGDVVVRSIDELPILAVVAAFVDGVTEFTDAAELRVKESDRIATTVAMLRAFGVDCEERRDGLAVVGQTGRSIAAARVDSAGDHRIAMAGAVLAMRANGPSLIDNVDNVKTSFPGFVSTMAKIGANLRERP